MVRKIARNLTDLCVRESMKGLSLPSLSGDVLGRTRELVVDQEDFDSAENFQKCRGDFFRLRDVLHTISLRAHYVKKPLTRNMDRGCLQ